MVFPEIRILHIVIAHGLYMDEEENELQWKERLE
jgi:hypothetical protein